MSNCPMRVIENYCEFKKKNSIQIIDKIDGSFRDFWTKNIFYTIKIVYHEAL
jgi:hypothetical protein